MTRSWSVLLVAGLACGTEPPAPGTLTVTLEDLPSLTTNTGLIVRGRITREPPVAEVPLAVNLTAGAATVADTADADGAFSMAITLATNATTAISVTGSDATGSTGPAATASVTHDGVPPTVVAWTPADLSDAAAPDVLTVQFSEPVQPGSVTFSVIEQGTAITGAVTVSADSTTLAFAPAAAFAPNAIIATRVSGIRDVAGNLAGGLGMCFTTGSAQAVFGDPMNDFVPGAAPGPTIVATDVIAVRFAHDAAQLRTIIRYTTARSLVASDPANTFVALDLDTDQDSSTGWPAIKDLAFGSTLPESRVGAEYGILLFVQNEPTDSSGVVQWSDTLTGTFTHRFLPTTCGQNIGFVIPRTSIGSGGGFHAVLYTDVFDGDNFAYADAAPDGGYFAVSLSAAVPDVVKAGPWAPPVVNGIRSWLERRLRHAIP